jgi:outer membrane protein
MRVLLPITALLSAGLMLAQEAPLFPTPSYFRRQFSTPQTRVELQPPARLHDFVVGDKLQLSLKDYLTLVMANNTDVALQRLTLETPKYSIMSAMGAFDPTLTANFTANRAKSQSTRSLDGADLLSTLSQNASLGYSQLLSTGTTFTVNFRDNRRSTNDAFSTFNPSHSGSIDFGFSQPLLRNRGSFFARYNVIVAQSTLRMSEYDFQNRLLDLIQQAENAYWAVIEARENLKVAQANLVLKQEALKRANRELELGASSPLDIYQPQADVATAEIQVSNSKFRLAQQEDALRKMIGVDLDPDVRKMPIELTEGILPPADEGSVDAEAAVQKALSLRPDLKSSEQQLGIDDLSIRNSRNLLRPQLDLTGTYTSSGVGGTQYFQSTHTVVPGGFGDFISNVFGFNLPTYQMGLRLTLPLRDRRNEATLANSLISKKRDTLNLRNAQQNARLSVLNAVNQYESAKAGVKLAQINVDLAQKQADAEQQKYDLGTQIMYFVLQAQDRLNSAKSNLVTQTISYQRYKTALLRQTGELLDERGIVIK